MEVPFGVSQKGIANGVEIRITHIPRAVQKLLNDELVTEFKTHFRGHLRKRKAYFLTETGTQKANALRDSLGNQMVTLKTNDGRIIEKNTLEMFESIGKSIPFFDFYQLCTKHSILDESLMENYKSQHPDQDDFGNDDFRDFSRNIPEHQSILGRTVEVAETERWFESNEKKVLFITGKRGIGKSALAAEAAKRNKDRYFIFWLNFPKSRNWDYLVSTLAEMASINNFFRLEKYIKHNPNITPAKTIELLSDDFTEINMLIVLEDIHNIQTGLEELSEWLVQILKNLPNWKTIITSEQPLPVELKSNTLLEDKYTEIKLGGLDILTSRELVRSDLTESEFESIYNYTEGNPLYLKAIKDMDADGKLDMKNFRPEELSLLKFLKMHEELE